MEHPCDKCGRPVEDGTPFCTHCNAPQIRVLIESPAVSANLPAVEPGATVIPNRPIGTGSNLLSPALQPCAVGAVVAMLAMLLGLVLPVALLGAGFMAVVLYRRRNPGTSVKAGDGARLGMISGVFCFVLSAILLAVAASMTDLKAQFSEGMLLAAGWWSTHFGIDLRSQATLDALKTNEGFVMVLISFLVGLLVMCILLAAAGGAAAGAILNRRGRPPSR